MQQGSSGRGSVLSLQPFITQFAGSAAATASLHALHKEPIEKQWGGEAHSVPIGFLSFLNRRNKMSGGNSIPTERKVSGFKTNGEEKNQF